MTVTLTINDTQLTVEKGTTILEASRAHDINIPTLCYLKDLAPEGSCRMCLVEVEGARALMTACSTACAEGMVVHTRTEKVVEARRFILDLLLSNHRRECFACAKSGECELQDLCYEYGVETSSYIGEKISGEIDDSNPFYTYDKSKCILCRRCVRVCNSLQCNGTLSISGRGFKTYVRPPFDHEIKQTNCVSCGNCVSACPVGALMPKDHSIRYRKWETRKVSTTCPYCGVGCQVNMILKGDTVVDIEPLDKTPNDGLLCVKGKFAYGFINHKDRLKKPLIRKNGKLVESEWDEALSLIVSKIKEIKKEHGADSIAGFSSARCTNEDNYVFQKFMRASIGTNNVDHCARLCHASTVAGLATTLGSGAMTNSIAEVLESDVIFVTGSNTTEAHPVIGAKIRQAVKNGAKLIVADPREIELAKQSTVFLQIKPGTNVALYNGMMHVILKEGLQDEEYIAERCENFDELKSVIDDYTPECVAEICGIDSQKLIDASRLYAKAQKAPIFYSMGVTQHSTGTEGVMSVSNLALICGKIGKPGCGVNPLRGQNNVQGACDMGCLPGDFPGYQKVLNPDVITKFENAWGVKLSNKPGLTVTETIPAIADGKIKMLYIMGENPMISDPDQNHVEQSLKSCDFLVVQDIFLTETAELADVVLPAGTYAEKEGTFTNTERRVQRVRRAIANVGESRSDWVILSEIMHQLGYENNFFTSQMVFEEIAKLTPSYGGISYERLETESLQWPCLNADHKGTPILHVGKFSRGERALLRPAEYKPSMELPDKEYPFIFSTGRVLYQYHTRTMTGKIPELTAILGTSYVEICPEDAAKLNVANGDRVEVWSRRGKIEANAMVTERVNEGNLFMPFHFADGPANKLTNPVLDPIAKIPEFKVCAAAIRKL